MSDKNSTFTSIGNAEREPGQSISRSDIWRERLDIFVLTPLRVMWSDWRTRFGGLIILLYVFVGTVGVRFVDQTTGPRYVGAFQTLEYPLGTGQLGQDVFAQIVHATPPMLKMILAGAVFSTILATFVGTVSGYKGGYVDTAMTTISDIAMTIPGLPLIIILLVVFEPQSPYIVGVVLAINAWAGLARTIRSQVLELRDQSYIEASRIMDVPLWRIIFDDILPNIMPYVLISFVNTARGVIFGSVALFYLGVLPVDFPNWGIMLSDAYSASGALYSLGRMYLIVTPMVAIVLLSFGLVLFSQGTERLFNPRIRARHAESIEETDPTTGE